MSLNMHRRNGLALYAALLNLYPRRYLREHRAELQQNFEDFAGAAPSSASLWLFIGWDLLASVVEEHMKSLNSLSGYVIAVVLVWAAIFVVGYYEKGPTPGYPALHVFGGFILGMIAMYIAMRFYPSTRKDSKS